MTRDLLQYEREVSEALTRDVADLRAQLATARADAWEQGKRAAMSAGDRAAYLVNPYKETDA